MKKFSWLLILLFSIGLIASCGDDDDDPVLPPGDVATTLTYVLDDEKVTLSWDGDVGDVYYTFYIFAASNLDDIASITKIAETTQNTYEITSINGVPLDNDNLYTFHVRTVREYEDNTEFYGDNHTDDVTVSPRPEGTDSIIWEFSSSDNPSGFGFNFGQAFSMTFADNHDKIDVYIGTDQDNDGDGTLQIKSPTLVESPNDWSKEAYIEDNGDFDLDDFGTALVSMTAQRQDIVLNHVYHIRFTDGADNQIHYAKMKVISIEDNFPNRTITFDWAYQNYPNLPQF
ncbi:MAG: hypothetical protein B6244_09085 [Candidatus Cloacimonetes bacterium 4572_55]|nr:MAG: hypothetical protein B6244_09085 [Candidatus Cloacimonetes bacterium 4572_55]